MLDRLYLNIGKSNFVRYYRNHYRNFIFWKFPSRAIFHRWEFIFSISFTINLSEAHNQTNDIRYNLFNSITLLFNKSILLFQWDDFWHKFSFTLVSPDWEVLCAAFKSQNNVLQRFSKCWFTFLIKCRVQNQWNRRRNTVLLQSYKNTLINGNSRSNRRRTLIKAMAYENWVRQD